MRNQRRSSAIAEIARFGCHYAVQGHSRSLIMDGFQLRGGVIEARSSPCPPARESGERYVSSPQRGLGRAPAAKRFCHIFSTGCPLLTLRFIFVTEDKVTGMLLTVAEITYLGPIPSSHSGQHCASQKLSPDWKHCNRQHKLHKG